MYAGIDPEENAALRTQIDKYPDRYLEIPGRDHGEHLDILRDFLNSNWTDDKELWTLAQNYNWVPSSRRVGIQEARG